MASKKMHFTKSPADFNVNFVFDIVDAHGVKKQGKLRIGNLAAYNYEEDQEVAPVHAFGGGADPVGIFTGKESVEGSVIFNVLNSDFETDLADILNHVDLDKPESVTNYGALAELKRAILVKKGADSDKNSSVSPNDIEIDDLPSIDIELKSKSESEDQSENVIDDKVYKEVITGVKFYESNTQLGLSNLGVNRLVRFKATKVLKLQEVA